MRYGIVLMLALSLQASTVARMACGGAGGTDPTGNVWTADTKTGGGAAWTSANQAALSAQPIPYQTLCYSAGAVPFSRTFAVPAGNYNVILKFLEPNKTAAGQRTFNVSINGAPVLIGLDVFSGAGAALRPYDRTFPVSAPGGFIQITAAGVIGNAVLSAVQIDTGVAAPSPVSFITGLESSAPACPSTGVTLFATSDTSHLFWCIAGSTWQPIGDVRNVVGSPTLLGVDQCTGSGVGWNCAGMLRARIARNDGLFLSIIGVNMATDGGPWSPMQ